MDRGAVSSLGLIGMRERAVSLGGSFELFTPAFGKGTGIKVLIPKEKKVSGIG